MLIKTIKTFKKLLIYIKKHYKNNKKDFKTFKKLLKTLIKLLIYIKKHYKNNKKTFKIFFCELKKKFRGRGLESHKKFSKKK